MKEAISRVFHPFVLHGFFVIMALHAIISVNNLYDDLWWMDIFMHGAGGFWVAGSAFIVFGYAQKSQTFNARMFWVLLMTTLVVGIAWEIFEVFVGWVPAPEFGLVPWFGASRDTVGDLVMDIVGALLFIPIALNLPNGRKSAKKEVS